MPSSTSVNAAFVSVNRAVAFGPGPTVKHQHESFLFLITTFSTTSLVVLVAVVAAISAGQLWSKRSKEKGTMVPTTDEHERLAALQSQGVHIGADTSGCSICQTSPLDPMHFWITLRPGEGVVGTTLYDLKEDQYYIFDKRPSGFEIIVGNEKFKGYSSESWEKLEKAGVLPLGHLMPDALEVLEDSTPESPTDLMYIEDCLAVVETLMQNPPSGYKKGSTGWILKFHRDKVEKMKKTFKRMGIAQSKSHDSFDQSSLGSPNEYYYLSARMAI
ncbi:hypothetical protein FOZ62_032139 [Perkinsus olseni]|uniref:Uncharacterized protein n=1 Tax=Perkinsus olseni TaxID=32597 RepID=A0A7J6NXA6_PEROL|nr:hypothetical protein FOZ62_032139 [Perkinsus olseni]